MIAQSTLHLHMTRACFSSNVYTDVYTRSFRFFPPNINLSPFSVYVASQKHLNMNPPCDQASGLHKQQLSTEYI